MLRALALLPLLVAGSAAAAPGGAVRAAAGARPPILFVAPAIGMTSLGGEATATWGARAAWALDPIITVGVAGELFADADGPLALSRGARTRGYWAGVTFQSTLRDSGRLRLLAAAAIGTGRACARIMDGRCADQETVALFEPTVGAELALGRAMSLAGSVGYRVGSSDRGRLDLGDLSGATARLALMVAVF